MLSKEEFERYNRQIQIDKIGAYGQLKLKSASVLIIGAGGIGNPISLYLASCGIGRIGLVDGDVVSLSNLGRQILYKTDDIGNKKVLIAKKGISKLNPEVKIDVYPEWLDEISAENIFIKYDMIVDATDNFETRYLINQVAFKQQKVLFIGAVGRFIGQIMSVKPGQTACFNCVFPEKEYSITSLMTERNLALGVTGTLVGIIGSIVSNEILKYTLGIGKNFFNELLIYDSLNNDFSVIKLSKNPKCKVCGTFKK